MLGRMVLLAALVGVVACARGVAVESEPGPVYTLLVENPMPHAMDVEFDDGSPHALGSVPEQASREFVISAPASRSVEIVARDAARTHTVRKTVMLQAGGVTRVTLTP